MSSTSDTAEAALAAYWDRTDVEPMCVCGHPASEHLHGTGECTMTVPEGSWDVFCACMRVTIPAAGAEGEGLSDGN